MEAVPRLPMISFQLKVSPEPTTFGPKLKQYIRDFYNEDAKSYSNEIHQLEALRCRAVRPPIDMAGCLLLKKYYCQLHFLQSRFPMGKDGAAAVTFSWKDTYANMVCSVASIHFEIISILYNIGCMHTQLGARTERSTADGMKMACAHFQCAAWAFEHLKNSFPRPSGVDLAPELMTFMHQLCLAQAQECILEKSMLDNRKPTIVAKVARQIVDYFTLALNTLDQGGSEDGTIADTVGTKIYQCWRRYVKFKKAYHLAVTHLYQGLAAEEQRKMGERVAFYNAALASLNEARVFYTYVKGTVGLTGCNEKKAVIEEALTFTNDVIEGKRKAAKNENEFIYHEEVPEKESLPVIKGASLVKGISFSINDPEVSGPDIFARLVPMKVHEASSLYSEEKAKLLRTVGSKIEEKDSQLNTFLTSLKLEHLNFWDPDVQTLDWEHLPLPEELIERCAALNAKQNIIQDLVNIMEKLSDTSQDVETGLKEIKKLLLEEESKEKQYQDAVGKRPPSIVATDLTRECKKYEEAHNKASESNQALHKAITMHVKNLKVLAQPLADLIAHVPSPHTYFSEQGSDKVQNGKKVDKTHVKDLKRILNKVEEMRRQRNDLFTQLRDSIAQDDLTRLLVTATSESGPLDRLFAEQLNKHQSLVNLIDQNLAAQENILTALTDAYAQTAELRKGVEEIFKRREHTVSSLIASYDAYEDLLTKATKGLEFYRKLEINVSKLLQRVKSTCKVQEEEREQILAQDNKYVYCKAESSISLSHDQEQSKTNNAPKLKDYLSNRMNNVATPPQNQYYNFYKDHPGSSRMDVLPTTKTFQNDLTDNSHSLPSASISTQIPNGKSTQQYHLGTYADSRMGSQYSYSSSAYGENLGVTNNISQNYLYPNKEDTMIYHPTNVTSASNTVLYPTTFTPNEQTFHVLHPDVQNAFPSNTQLPYNLHSAVQYDPMDYSNRHVTEQDSNLYKHYTPNQNKSNAIGATESTEIVSQIQSMSLMSTSTSTTAIGNASLLQDQSKQIYSIAHPEQQYISKNSQGTIMNAESSHNVVQNQPVMDNYTLPQINQGSMAYHQNYSNLDFANSGKIQNQQIAPNCDVHATNDYVTSMPYLQMQHGNVGIQSAQSATVTLASNLNETPVTYPSNLHNTNIVQYNQDDYANQHIQSNVPVNYSTNYQGMYQLSSGLPQRQNITITTGTCTNYPYTNSTSTSEVIQSHTKVNNVPNYSQSYEYPHQAHYAVYGQCSNYSQGYNYGYPYVQDSSSASTMTEPYESQSAYRCNSMEPEQIHYYNLNQQPLPATPMLTSQSVTTTLGNAYQSQESNARYTNASNNTTVCQTPSSQYSSQVSESQFPPETYYTAPYGLQMQGQAGSNARPENHSSYGQTYMQAVNNNGTNTTTSSDPMKLTTKSVEEKSNVDLLSDLDVTINHAPLVPEVRPLNKMPHEPPENVSSNSSECGNVDKNIQEQDTIEKISTSTETKTENENLQIVWDTWYTDVQPKKDPLGNPDVLQKFINDVEKYEKFIDSLLVKTLSGATNLDIKWKEVQEFEARETEKQPCTVALAHSSDNRVADCISYDATRVQISSLDISSSYINASHVVEITQWTPTAFIITQAPMSKNQDVFWMMVWEQECEVIACLTSNAQLKEEIYWATDIKENLDIGMFTISLKKMINHASYIQRIFCLYNNKMKSERTVVHMQFLAWPPNDFPSSPGALLTFSTDVMTEQALRRCSPKPIVVHCLTGGSLSGLFLLAASTVCHIRAGRGIADVPLVFKSLIKCRKQVVNKESLLFAYRMVLYHAQDILMKRGILSSTRSTFEGFERKEKTLRKLHHCHPSDDFLHNLEVQYPETKQQGEETQRMLATNSSGQASSTSTDKLNEAFVDPLSQLDPLWSIRK